WRPPSIPFPRVGKCGPTRVCRIAHCRLYMRLAAVRARVHPARLPCASSRLARAMVALNDACARSSARFTEPGVGWRSICAPIDCGAIGPAFGFPADCRTACSNCAISLVQGPACAGGTPRQRAAAIKAALVFMALASIALVLKRKDALPIVLHADHCPAVPFCLVVERRGE